MLHARCRIPRELFRTAPSQGLSIHCQGFAASLLSREIGALNLIIRPAVDYVNSRTGYSPVGEITIPAGSWKKQSAVRMAVLVRLKVLLRHIPLAQALGVTLVCIKPGGDRARLEPES